MLELRGVTYRHGARTLIDRVDVEFDPGTITVLVGPAGAGKTSLLGLLAGDLIPSEGGVLLDERILCGSAACPDELAIDGAAPIRMDVARVAARDTDYILIDEAATHLAVKRQYDVLALFHRLATSGATVIAAMRDLNAAMRFADRIILMDRGQIVTDGLPEIVLQPSLLRRVFGQKCAAQKPLRTCYN
jgi:ABC-type cobalamin/Fe3+-siderophores transport system ATPase subunit